MDWQKSADRVNKAVRRTFGEAIVYTPEVGDPLTIRAVFDEAYAFVDVQQGVPVQSLRPMLDVRLADLPALPLQGETFAVTRTGKTYEVADVQPEGNGTAKLICLRLAV